MTATSCKKRDHATQALTTQVSIVAVMTGDSDICRPGIDHTLVFIDTVARSCRPGIDHTPVFVVTVMTGHRLPLEPTPNLVTISAKLSIDLGVAVYIDFANKLHLGFGTGFSPDESVARSNALPRM